MEPPPRDIVGACLDQAAQVGRGKPAGQRAQGGDAGAHEVVRPERGKQVGLRGRKLGLHAADIAALPETLRRQGHIRAKQRVQDGAGGAQTSQDGLDRAVIFRELAHQFGEHGLDAGCEFHAMTGKNELQRRLRLWGAPAHDLGMAEFAQNARHRFGIGRRQSAGFARQGVRTRLERRRHMVVAAQKHTQPAPAEQAGGNQPGQLRAVDHDVKVVGVHEGTPVSGTRVE